MAKTNWQDPQTSEIRSTHISGLMDAVGKLEDSIGMNTIAESNIPLTEIYISENDRYRIFQAPAGKRNWLSSPAPVIKKNGVVITEGFVIDYGGGAIALSVNDTEENTYTADATYVTPLNTSFKSHLAENVQSPKTFGAHSITEAGYESFDSTQAFIDMFAAFPNGIKVECKPDDVYIVNNVPLSISNIDMDFKGATIKKVSGSGYIFDFGGSLTQKNISIKNVTLEGDNTVTANGGLGIANNELTDAIDGLVLENIICKNFAQYGISIGSVSNASYKNIRIENHGSVAVGATTGIGFVIFPRNPQENIVIDGLYSEINLESTLTSAAIKIQTASRIQATNIIAVNGTEEVMVIDSTHNSEYTNIIVECADSVARPGFAVQSNTIITEPDITDASFTVSNVKFKGNFSSAFIMGDTKDCQFNDFDFSLCTAGSRTIVTANKTVQDCQFNDWKIGLFDSMVNVGTAVTDCEFNNITCTSGTFTINGDNNDVSNLKVRNGGVIYIGGNDNIVHDGRSINSSSHGFQVAGNNNILKKCLAKNPTSRNVWIQSGTGNRIDLEMIGGTGWLDNGTGTIGLKKGVTGLRPTLTSSDIGYMYLDTTLDADGKPIWWVGAAWVDATGAVV